MTESPINPSVPSGTYVHFLIMHEWKVSGFSEKLRRISTKQNVASGGYIPLSQGGGLICPEQVVSASANGNRQSRGTRKT